ncbi:MAG: hypothetical protein LBV47_05650 [Bacteroidales bacterium]|nr:hypothetical protein [Bacteroidales bacterium]
MHPKRLISFFRYLAFWSVWRYETHTGGFRMFLKIFVMNSFGFKSFEISKSKLDQIKGGKVVVSSVYTGSGKNATNGSTVYEYIDNYDDGTFLRYVRAEALPCIN